MSIAAAGSAGTWEILPFPRIKKAAHRVAAHSNTPALWRRVGRDMGANRPAQPWYRQAKENEARREEWREVLAS